MSGQRLHKLYSRRDFIRQLTALAGAGAASSTLRALAAAPNSASPLSVVIVGAGLAGLCAAYELERRGHRVTLLEADSRHVGGRVRTLRFADGLYGEAGAMRIPARHEVTRHYVRELGVPLRKFVHSNPQAYYYVRGERRRIAEVRELNARYALRDAERSRTPDDFWADAVSNLLPPLTDAEKADLSADTPKTAKIRAYDEQSLQQLCEAAGLSDEAIEFLAVTSGSETLLQSAATEHLREELKEVWSQGFDEIVGGTDRLASAFALPLKSKPKLGCRGHAACAGCRPAAGERDVHGRRRRAARRRRFPPLHAAVSGAVADRGRARRSPAARRGPSASSTTIHRPRCLPSPAGAFGKPTTASTAAARSPTCRPGRRTTLPTTRSSRARRSRRGRL